MKKVVQILRIAINLRRPAGSPTRITRARTTRIQRGPDGKDTVRASLATAIREMVTVRRELP